MPYVRLNHINSKAIPIIICRLGRFVFTGGGDGGSASERGRLTFICFCCCCCCCIFFVGVAIGWRGIMQKRESSYCRSPEVGISVLFYSTCIHHQCSENISTIVLLHVIWIFSGAKHEDFKPTKIVFI